MSWSHASIVSPGTLRRLGVSWGFVLAPALALGCDRNPKMEESVEPAGAHHALAPAPLLPNRAANEPSPAPSGAAAPSAAPGSSPSTARDAAAPRAPLPPATPDLPPTDAPRVYAKSRNVWIRSGPGTENQWIGMMWFGGSVKVRADKPLNGPGCNEPWTPVEPRGWICVDGETATKDPRDPVLVAIYPYRPRVDTPWPHHYAEIHEPTRRYPQLPDEALQRAWELNFDRHARAVAAARLEKSVPAELGPIDVTLTGRLAPELPPLPRGLSEKRDRIAPRSALAYADAFDHGERAFLLAADLTWVPRDRVELLPPSQFQGVELKGDLALPVAFFRGRERLAYRRDAQGAFHSTEEKFDRLSYVALSGQTAEADGVRYHQLRGRDLWLSEKDAVIPNPGPKTPWGAALGAVDDTGLAPAGRATWIEVSILSGWLVAFEGTRAVYATMISAGRGGTPQGDKDPLTTASTPTGRFSVTGKFKTATMESSSGPIVHGDVPWTQNFSGPHAIHGAYWHDDWGNLKSAGCVNVSPRDGKWLFEYSEPEVPEGWHGVKHVARYGNATRVVIHE